MRAPGWTISERDITRLTMLDWVEESTKGNRIPSIAEFVDAHRPFNADKDTTLSILGSLEADGLVRTQNSLAGGLTAHVMLTARGREDVADRVERRRDRPLRRRACREALLHWVAQQTDDGKKSPVLDHFLQAPQGNFEGIPFGVDEMHDASRYLRDKGFLAGGASFGGGVARPSLTCEGEEVVEEYNGSLRAYERAHLPTGQRTTHFHGDVHGQVAVGDHATQTQQLGSRDQVLALVQAVREAAATLPVSDAGAALAYAGVVEAEITSNASDPNLAVGALDRLKRVAGTAGDTAFKAAVVALTARLTDG